MIPDISSYFSHFFSDSPSSSEQAKSKREEVAKLVAAALGFSAGVVSDLAVLPAAGAVLLLEKTMGYFNTDFNPKPEEAKIGKPAIVLLHGSGFCQAQWDLARLFLMDEEFGSVYSLNYAEGLTFNHPDSSIGDYARGEKLRTLMSKIKEDTKQNRVIIIGHSMGSLVGECFAQRHADEMEIEIPHLLSISTPWQGTPTVDLLGLKARRFQEMSQVSGAPEHIAFRQNLIEEAQKAEKLGKRLQWNIWCKHDRAVPGKTGCLTEEPSRQYEVSAMGHYTPMVSLTVLTQMRTWVKQMYATIPVLQD